MMLLENKSGGGLLLWLSLSLSILVVVVRGQSCARFGGGSCCPNLDPVHDDITESFQKQPYYYKILPKTIDNEGIDNICVTYFPLPDDPKTFLVYISKVYLNGYNTISSFIGNQPEPGVSRNGNGLYSFSETKFAKANHTNVDPACVVTLGHKCFLRGDYTTDTTAGVSAAVFGLSDIRRPITRSCLNSLEFTIQNSGLPKQDYIILPMKLPTKCVFNQVCSVQPAKQRFREAVGLAFPSLAF